MGKSRVLIVDDKPANLLALDALLADYVDEAGEGIEVLQADSGEKALQVILESNVDLLLLDVHMPGMDGYETARLVAMSERSKTIPIIFLSAVYSDEIHMSRGYQGGAIDFISKPINQNLLKAKIGNFLKIQRAIRKAGEAQKEKEAVLEATRLKSQFLMNMNHELRTPMNGVLGMADFVLVSTALSDEQRECIETIKSCGKQMLRLIDDIVDIASLEARQLDLHVRPFYFERLVNEISELYRYQIESKRLEYEFHVDPLLCVPFLGDAQRVKQVIMNLLSNAVKFTDHGKISLLVSGQKTATHVLTEIKVRDTGKGIGKKEEDALFNLFSQGDCSTTKRYGGAGLGLIITQRLVELMNGKITWNSEVGKGSCFTVSIPFQLEGTQVKPMDEQLTAIATELAAVKTDPAMSKPNGTILIVDDNLINQKVAKRMVKNMGYECETAVNGIEGVEAFKRRADFDAILMDCLMPGMDGFEATNVIRKLQTRHVPIIAITANTTEIDQEKCLSAGMDSFIAKPIEFDVLAKELKRWKKGA